MEIQQDAQTAAEPLSLHGLKNFGCMTWYIRVYHQAKRITTAIRQP